MRATRIAPRIVWTVNTGANMTARPGPKTPKTPLGAIRKKEHELKVPKDQRLEKQKSEGKKPR